MTRWNIRSPLPWIGGKYFSAAHIVEAFPAPEAYDVYVDLFGGAAHVLLQKPLYKRHAEVYNDLNGDLVNFWLTCRDHARELEERCRSLPYSRELYYQYHASLYNGQEQLDPLERAARWFYVARSSFAGWEHPSSASGWKGSAFRNEARSYRSACDLFALLQARFAEVLIDHRDFEPVFRSYDRHQTFFYVDPPYLGAEGYYSPVFTLADHRRLASLLNETQALVAVSYAPHPLLETLYPPSQWRRITWEVYRHSQRTRAHREKATEVLLCNYPPPELSLWEEERGKS
jgi:DNA adenine methylase